MDAAIAPIKTAPPIFSQVPGRHSSLMAAFAGTFFHRVKSGLPVFGPKLSFTNTNQE
jgi:hypothetical protein